MKLKLVQIQRIYETISSMEFQLHELFIAGRGKLL